MPVMQKITNVFHRKNSAPAAPALPAAPLSQSTTTTQTLTNEMLLNQRQALTETVYDNSALGGQTLLEERALENQTFNQTLGEDFVGTGNRSSLLLRQEPTIIERVEKEMVIQERIHPVEKEEIQPIIYREREQLDVRQITEMMHETQVQPTLVQQRELAPEYREAVIERSAPLPSNIVLPTREVDATLTSREVRAPIVEEVIKKTVIEEVQPVIERDIIAPTVIQQTQAIYEKIIEAPVVTREIRGARELGTRGLGNETVYNAGLYQGAHHNPLDRNFDGRVDARDLAPNAGLNQGLAGAHHNPLDRNFDGRVDAKDLSSRQYSSQYESGSLSSSLYEQQMRDQQLLSEQQFQQQQFLPTGQMLPAVASSRPAYAYLPAGSVERRPDFVGTGSQYVLAAKNLPLAHNRGLHTLNTYAQPGAPQNYLSQ